MARLTIALGIALGAVAAGKRASRRGTDPDPLFTLTALLAASGVVGGRIFYVIEHPQEIQLHRVADVVETARPQGAFLVARSSESYNA